MRSDAIDEASAACRAGLKGSGKTDIEPACASLSPSRARGLRLNCCLQGLAYFFLLLLMPGPLAGPPPGGLLLLLGQPECWRVLTLRALRELSPPDKLHSQGSSAPRVLRHLSHRVTHCLACTKLNQQWMGIKSDRIYRRAVWTRLFGDVALAVLQGKESRRTSIFV